jgi:hypothetical protein
MVPTETQEILYPETCGYASIRIVGSEHEDQAVNEDQPVDQRSELKPRIDGKENGCPNQDGEDLQIPSGAIVGTHSGNDQGH